MNARRIAHTALLSTFLLLSASAARAATFTMVWDNTSSTTGTVSYDGAGGALVGTNIQLWDLFEFNDDSTGADPDATFTCSNCVLNFTTGANVLEFSPSVFWFDGGGSFTLTGTLFDGATQVNTSSNVLLSGTFVSNGLFAATVGQNPSNSAMTVTGFGIDEKNSELLSYLGILSATWSFANTNITLAGCTPDASGAFSCSVFEGDITNSATDGVRDNPVPEPGSMILLGSGLVGLAGAVRRRRARK